MRALTGQDISCLGKSSTTVVLPVMEALSVETALLPTALLSTQTDGFDDIYIVEGSDWIDNIWKRFESMGVTFDGMYSGYLGSAGQVEKVRDIFSSQDGLKFVDPVLGDNGELYSTISRDHASEMIRLVKKADVITPNFTEAMILTGLEDGIRKAGQKDIHDLVTVLRSYGPERGVITSVPLVAGGYGNIAWQNDEIRIFSFEDAGASYPGSGDLFASVLFSLVLRGDSFFGSAKHATDIASYTVMKSRSIGRERRMGIYLTAALEEIRRRML